jgi:hypothetical protein
MNNPIHKEGPPVDLGIRYKCYKCGVKFYDMGRTQPLCPSCGANQLDDKSKEMTKRRRRPYSTGKAEPNIIAQQESENHIEVVNEADADYASDIEDSVMEGHEER